MRQTHTFETTIIGASGALTVAVEANDTGGLSEVDVSNVSIRLADLPDALRELARELEAALREMPAHATPTCAKEA
jgi:hypothetical protein